MNKLKYISILLLFTVTGFAQVAPNPDANTVVIPCKDCPVQDIEYNGINDTDFANGDIIFYFQYDTIVTDTGTLYIQNVLNADGVVFSTDTICVPPKDPLSDITVIAENDAYTVECCAENLNVLENDMPCTDSDGNPLAYTMEIVSYDATCFKEIDCDKFGLDFCFEDCTIAQTCEIEYLLLCSDGSVDTATVTIMNDPQPVGSIVGSKSFQKEDQAGDLVDVGTANTGDIIYAELQVCASNGPTNPDGSPTGPVEISQIEDTFDACLGNLFVAGAFTTSGGTVSGNDVTISGQTVTATGLPTLQPSECHTFIIGAEITCASGWSAIPNVLTVEGDGNGDGVVGDTYDSSVDQVVEFQCPIELTKVVNSIGGNSLVGDTIYYDFEVCNTCSVDQTNVTLSDNNAVITATPIATLAAGTCTIISNGAYHIITALDSIAGSVINQASVEGNYIGPDGVAGTTSDTSDDPTDATDNDSNGDGDPDDPTVTSLCQGICYASDGTTTDCDDETGFIVWAIDNQVHQNQLTSGDFNNDGGINTYSVGWPQNIINANTGMSWQFGSIIAHTDDTGSVKYGNCLSGGTLYPHVIPLNNGNQNWIICEVTVNGVSTPVNEIVPDGAGTTLSFQELLPGLLNTGLIPGEQFTGSVNQFGQTTNCLTNNSAAYFWGVPCNYSPKITSISFKICDTNEDNVFVEFEYLQVF